MKKPKRRSRSDLSDSPTLLVKEPITLAHRWREHNEGQFIFVRVLYSHILRKEPDETPWLLFQP